MEGKDDITTFFAQREAFFDLLKQEPQDATAIDQAHGDVMKTYARLVDHHTMPQN